MTLNLTIPPQAHTDFTPRITVIGVGGGGTNAVDNMIAANLQGVEFVVANTDAQQLMHSRADRRIQLGPHITQGLGAGAKPEIGRAAAEEASDELYRHLDGAHMVFITAGMGGGTGTGAAPVIARMARERNILTVGVVTKPFGFEGARRSRAADEGIEELQQYVDTLIVIPNQNLFRMANERTTWKDAFKMADQVLYMGVRGVTDLMMVHGLINLDFADIRAVMAEMGKAMMGTGEADGENRAVRAAEAAINNPLLEDTSMAGAKGLLINITGGEDLTLFEVDQAVTRIRDEVDEEANVIFGSAIDESLSGRIRVSVVATGIDSPHSAEAQRPRLVAVSGGAMPAPQPIPMPGGVMSVGAMAGGQISGGQISAGAMMLGQPAPTQAAIPQMRATSPFQEAPVLEAPVLAHEHAPATQQRVAPTFTHAPPPPLRQPVLPVHQPTTAPHIGAQQAAAQPLVAPVMESRSPLFASAVRTPSGGAVSMPTSAAPAHIPEPTGPSLFGRMTGAFRRRSHSAHETAPARREPSQVEPQAVATSASVQQAYAGDEQPGLEVPAFLRRQASTS